MSIRNIYKWFFIGMGVLTAILLVTFGVMTFSNRATLKANRQTQAEVTKLSKGTSVAKSARETFPEDKYYQQNLRTLKNVQVAKEDEGTYLTDSLYKLPDKINKDTEAVFLYYYPNTAQGNLLKKRVPEYLKHSDSYKVYIVYGSVESQPLQATKLYHQLKGDTEGKNLVGYSVKDGELMKTYTAGYRYNNLPVKVAGETEE